MSKSTALTSARNRQRSLNAAEAKATDLAAQRDRAVYRAQGEGATYAEIQAATGLSIARITQILRRVRRAQ